MKKGVFSLGCKRRKNWVLDIGGEDSKGQVQEFRLSALIRKKEEEYEHDSEMLLEGVCISLSKVNTS